ncbi:MAG: VOC family protein [Acidimicrobiia bacterium]|jgi:predicted enzyme related to lactoylglutathione lyase
MTTHFGFTKLVVHDLEVCAAFYTAVLGVEEQRRVEGSVAGRPIEEILYGATAPGGGSFILLRYLDSEAPSRDEVILGVWTDDIRALFDRAVAAGGSVPQPIAESPAHGVHLGFLADPEGHLIEVVQPL